MKHGRFLQGEGTMNNLYSMGSRHSRINDTEDSGRTIISADITMTPSTLCSRGLITYGSLRAYSSKSRNKTEDLIDSNCD